MEIALQSYKIQIELQDSQVAWSDPVLHYTTQYTGRPDQNSEMRLRVFPSPAVAVAAAAPEPPTEARQTIQIG